MKFSPVILETTAASTVMQYLQEAAASLIKGLLVLVIGIVLVRILLKAIHKSKGFQKADQSTGGFLGSILKAVLYIIVVISAIGAFGVPLSSIIALLGTAGVAISLGLQGALSNFVGGVVILAQKLFSAGDYISVGGSEGTVERIGAFYTTLMTVDNKRVSLPNSTLTNTAIVNYSSEKLRMADASFYVPYDADVSKIREVLIQMAKDSGYAREDEKHPTVVVVGDLTAASVKVVLRCWTGNADYWPLKNYMMEHGKTVLAEAGYKASTAEPSVFIKQ